jgi:hypothetical protein
MAIKEQICTFKIRWDDGEDNVCEDEEDCCGVGGCENRKLSPEETHQNGDLFCCYGTDHADLLNASPVRDVVTE